MNCRLLSVSLFLLTSLIFTQTSIGDAAPGKSKEKPSAPPQPATVKAEKGPITAAVTAKGTIEALHFSELAFRAKAWSGSLQVKKVLEHGAKVKAGDVVLEFDTEKLELAIRDAKQERELAELALRQTESELAILEKQAPIDLEVAVRDEKQAAEDLTRFMTIDKPLQIESANQQLKNVAFFLETAKDELKQLSKMYKDKDLTEETEEIVLKRYKHNVTQSEFQYKQTQSRTEQTLKIDLPRKELTAKDALMKSTIALTRAKTVAPLAMKQKQLSYAKQKYDENKSAVKLADLEKDLAAMKVTAPIDGVVYHGRCVRGQWSLPTGGTLAPHSNVTGSDVFMTIVKPTDLMVRLEIEEKELAGLKVGQTGKLHATAYPDQKVAVKVTKIATAPISGKFEVQTDLTGDTTSLLPGMTGSVRIVTAKKENAVTVPTSAIFEDEATDTKYVYKTKKSAEPVKVTVKVGMTMGDKTEILEGLVAGDEILTSKPTPPGTKS